MVLSPFGKDFGFGYFATSARSKEVPAVLKSAVHAQELRYALSSKSITRQLSYLAGRAALRAALTELEFNPIELHKHPILSQDSGAPELPAGVIGSISHTEVAGQIHAVAVVGPSYITSALGIDIEDLKREIAPKFADRVATPLELNWINEDSSVARHRTIMLFSAKEAIYKAFSSYSGAALTFHDVELEWDSELEAFTAKITNAAKVPESSLWTTKQSFSVNSKLSGNLLLSWILVKPWELHLPIDQTSRADHNRQVSV